MKYLSYLLLLSFCSVLPCSYSVAGETTAGIIHRYHKETLNNLSTSGRVTLEGTKITGPLEVNGSVSCQDAHLGIVSVNGQISFYNTTVDGKCDISGFLSAEKSIFHKEIDVTAQRITFQDSTIDSLYVRKTIWPFGKQVVELTNSTCKGNIIFESGKGYVLLSHESKVLGKVEGGEVAKSLTK